MDFKTRLKLKRQEKGFSQPKLSKLCGYPDQRISNYEVGHRIPPTKAVEVIAKVLGVTPQWLLFGTENVPREKIPLINWQQVSDWVIKQNKPTQIDSTSEYIYIPDPNLVCENLFALRLKDDSMSSTERCFNIGAVIIVSTQAEIKSGSFVVCFKRGEDEAFFRQYIVHNKRGFLKPLNPQWPSEEMMDDINIIGVVIYSQMSIESP